MSDIYDIDALDCAADALRRYEYAGKMLNLWADISSSQRKRWRLKAAQVLEGYHNEIARQKAHKEDVA